MVAPPLNSSKGRWGVQRSVFGRVLVHSSLAVVVALVLGALVGLVYSLAQQPVYAASARVIVVADPDQYTFSELPAMYLSQRRVPNYRSLLTSPAVLRRSIDFHGLPTTVEYLEKNLTITSPRDTSLIDITVSAPTGQLAADYASAIAQEFVAAASELEHKGAIHARVVASAAVPSRPVGPRTAENIANAALALALAAAVVNLYRARPNPKLSYLPNIRTIGGVPVIGAIAIGGRTYLQWRRSKVRQTAQISREVDRIADRLIAAGPPAGENPPPRQEARRVTPPPALRYLRACFGDAEGWLIVAGGREPHSDVGKYTHNRWEVLMSDVLARGFAESRPTAGAATSQAAVGTAARPVHIGITSAGSRWKEARRFADELRRDDRQAVLVIANEVKA
jgi:capsular polysaccharide biosynthesis protein